MKKIVLILLAGVLVLSAVQWEIEQVTTGFVDAYPVIALDDSGNVGIAFSRYNVEVSDLLMFASNISGSWDVTFVDSVMGWYSMDFNSKGNVFIAYVTGENSNDSMDVYLATDSSGEFTIHNLTDNPLDRSVTSTKVDSNDKLHLLYEEQDETHHLYCGWFDDEGFCTELVTDSLRTSWTFDLVVDHDSKPHAFYGGSPGGIWHASRPTISSFPQWNNELIIGGSPWELSADIDKDGCFHLAYDEWIYHLSDRTGMWEEEWAADATAGEDIDGVAPSIALDPKNRPHIVWLRFDQSAEEEDIYYSGETETGWLQEPITTTPYLEKAVDRDYFTIDTEGYGHLVYSEIDENEEHGEIYYAKTTEPLTEPSTVGEHPFAYNPLGLEIQGSTVHFSIPVSGKICLNLYDVSGRHVSHLASDNFEAGTHSLPINTSGLSSGVYIVQADLDGKLSESAKMIIAR